MVHSLINNVKFARKVTCHWSRSNLFEPSGLITGGQISGGDVIGVDNVSLLFRRCSKSGRHCPAENSMVKRSLVLGLALQSYKGKFDEC